MPLEKISYTGRPHFGKHCIMPCGLFERCIFQFLNLSFSFWTLKAGDISPYTKQRAENSHFLFVNSILYNGLVWYLSGDGHSVVLPGLFRSIAFSFVIFFSPEQCYVWSSLMQSSGPCGCKWSVTDEISAIVISYYPNLSIIFVLLMC